VLDSVLCLLDSGVQRSKSGEAGAVESAFQFRLEVLDAFPTTIEYYNQLLRDQPLLVQTESYIRIVVYHYYLGKTDLFGLENGFRETNEHILSRFEST